MERVEDAEASSDAELLEYLLDLAAATDQEFSFR